jgi:hypothetical protein
MILHSLLLFSEDVCASIKVLLNQFQGVEPVFLEKDQAINYAQGRVCFRSGEIRILDSTGNFERVIPFNDTNRKL